jgi:hypothetical protein
MSEKCVIKLLYYLPMERMTPDTTDFNSLSKKQLVELVITKYNDCFRLEEENKKLRDYADNLDSENDNQAIEIEELKKENKELKEIIKDHQFYEEKLEHRIIEFEELLH